MRQNATERCFVILDWSVCTPPSTKARLTVSFVLFHFDIDFVLCAEKAYLTYNYIIHERVALRLPFIWRMICLGGGVSVKQSLKASASY